jgi:hypothetical protein
LGKQREYDPVNAVRSLGMPQYGRSITVALIEQVCPYIFNCIKKFKAVGTWREYPRDYFYKDLGCFSVYKECGDYLKYENNKKTD